MFWVRLVGHLSNVSSPVWQRLSARDVAGAPYPAPPLPGRSYGNIPDGCGATADCHDHRKACVMSEYALYLSGSGSMSSAVPPIWHCTYLFSYMLDAEQTSQLAEICWQACRRRVESYQMFVSAVFIHWAVAHRRLRPPTWADIRGEMSVTRAVQNCQWRRQAKWRAIRKCSHHVAVMFSGKLNSGKPVPLLTV